MALPITSWVITTSIGSIRNALAIALCAGCSASDLKFRSDPRACSLPSLRHLLFEKEGDPVSAPNGQSLANTAENNQEFSKDSPEGTARICRTPGAAARSAADRVIESDQGRGRRQLRSQRDRAGEVVLWPEMN